MPAGNIYFFCLLGNGLTQQTVNFSDILILGYTDSGAGAWCKGNCRYKFWIIIHTMALVGICPGPVEDIFSLGIIFQEERHDGDGCHRFFIVFIITVGTFFNHHMIWLPSGDCGGTVALFQGKKKSMLHKWIVLASQCIPVSSINFFNAGEEMQVKDICGLGTQAFSGKGHAKHIREFTAPGCMAKGLISWQLLWQPSWQ